MIDFLIVNLKETRTPKCRRLEPTWACRASLVATDSERDECA